MYYVNLHRGMVPFWSKVSAFMKDRSAKSCSERWTNHLSGADKSEITQDEEFVITKFHIEGLPIAQIAIKFENRSIRWVRKQYEILLRKHIKAIVLHNNDKSLKKDQVCEMVK